MGQTHNSLAAGASNNVSGVDYLLVDGNVNFGKDKGQGQLLFTRTSVFAFRGNNAAMMAGGALGGLIGAIVGYFIDKQLAKKKSAPEHMEDPELQLLGESVQKKTERASLLAKFPLDTSLEIKRTKSGFTLANGDKTSVVYQGFFNKKKITEFLAMQGIDVR